MKVQSPLDFALKNYNKKNLKTLHQNEDLKNLIEKCLTIDHEMRPSSSALFEDPIFSGNAKAFATNEEYKLKKSMGIQDNLAMSTQRDLKSKLLNFRA